MIDFEGLMRKMAGMKKFLFVLSFFVVSVAWAKPIGTGPVKTELIEESLVVDGFTITFQRTLRIPNNGIKYPLPPGLGRFPIYRVQDYARKLPESWVKEGGVFIPMYQREAMWIAFGGEEWRPRAVKIGIGNVNALTGEKFVADLKSAGEQDYLVAPAPQPWIDGIKAGAGFIRQFVAVRLGEGITVEGQVTGEEKVGGLQIAVYNPVKGKFKKPPQEHGGPRMMGMEMSATAPAGGGGGAEMGLGAGGTMTQKIYHDPHGLAVWDPAQFAVIHVHIINSEMFQKITGKKPPESPVTQKDYESFGYPWFALYDENYADLKAKEKLSKVKPVPGKDSPIAVKKVIKYKVPELPPPEQRAKDSKEKEPPSRRP